MKYKDYIKQIKTQPNVNSQLNTPHVIVIAHLWPLGDTTLRCTADPWEAAFLYQRISVAIQRFNAQCAWPIR